MAVIVVVRQFGSCNRKIAVAMDLEYGNKMGGCPLLGPSLMWISGSSCFLLLGRLALFFTRWRCRAMQVYVAMIRQILISK